MELPSFVKKIVFFFLYGSVLTLLSLYLFFPGAFLAVTAWAKGAFFSGMTDSQVSSQDAVLKIGLSSVTTGLEPTSLDTTTRTLALQVYEPLVRTDAFLRIEPALASSWGRLDALSWQFTLRSGALFHNNRAVAVSDVVASFRRATESEHSDLRDLVRDITVVRKSDQVFEIHTSRPDALLLQKISQVLIIPQENEKKALFAPIGTGPYVYSDVEKGKMFSFKRFENYWGELPKHPSVDFIFYPGASDRARALQNGDVDIMKDITPEQVNLVERSGATLHVLPSLEVNFLVFNVGGVFHDLSLRKAVSLALDSSQFEKFASGYALRANQFVSSGVFGFDTRIPQRVLDVSKAKEIVKRKSEFDLIPVKLSFVEGLETAGEYVKKQLSSIGFSPEVTYISWSQFRENLTSNTADLFFFGWKSDLGSSGDFFLSAAHSRQSSSGYGQFNVGNYGNKALDALIEKSTSEFDDNKRLTMYQDAMRQIVEKDPYGVPLFESQVLYASNPDISFQPRIDGYILARDIR